MFFILSIKPIYAEDSLDLYYVLKNIETGEVINNETINLSYRSTEIDKSQQDIILIQANTLFLIYSFVINKIG